MMVIDTVHSSGVGRMHAGQIRQMKIVRPLQGSEAKGTVEKKGTTTNTVNLESRPSLVIRRRIMVRQLEEADDNQLTPALSNSLTTATSLNHFQEKKKLMDYSASTRSHSDVIFARSSAAMAKPPKTMHLFDLNKLPTSPDEDVSSVESPTSTIASADSTTGGASIPAITDSSPIIRTISGAVHRGGATLAVDLGLLPPTSVDTTRRHSVEDLPMQCTDVLPTPARKRLRKLSEYAATTHDHPFMAKSSWTADHGGHVSPEPETKDDDEVLGAASVLMMLMSSSKKRRREFFVDEEEGRGVGPSTPDDSTSSRSLGSGGSILLRPSNKQRYRSIGEVMAQTPILKRA